ncbi:ABC transporter substrate-binding protein, partial [Corallococcus carmarthensis]|nr:ABC transporter substrate-binding protein [Corallococcus carmarthensis]
MRSIHFIGRIALAGALSLGLAQAALAQAGYPVKPIRLVVPYPAGGATDVAARTLQPRLQEELGQPIIVEN